MAIRPVPHLSLSTEVDDTGTSPDKAIPVPPTQNH